MGSQQEEDCEENFRKSCFIEYEQIAFNETAEICRTPLVKDCDIQGPEICRTEYESECWTKQGGLQCVQEASEEVHPYHRMYQGAQGALCPCRLWFQAGH